LRERERAVWVKICGITDEAGRDAALAAGADALGFVFHPGSPRHVSPQRAAALAAPVRGRARCVAVTLHPSQAQVDEILASFAPDILQTDAEDFAQLRLPGSLERLPVVRGAPPLQRPAAGRVLFEGLVSGTGELSDWAQAGEWARHAQVVLAGGLRPENVAAAVRAVRPAGVDVSSGVEQARGVKSPALIAEFVAAAREAARQVEGQQA
jgi:phosphoribosylanthranilate isomerase